MIFTRIKRGATRSLLLVKHKLSSTPRLTSNTSWRKVRNFILNAMVVRAIVLPIPLLAPASAQAATADEAEPPSIVRLSTQAADALTFTPTPANALSIQTGSLQGVKIGKSIEAEQQEQAQAQAAQKAAEAQAQAEAERQATAAKAAQQARIFAEAQQAVPTDGNTIMDAVGIPEGDRFYVNFIISRESGWGGTFTYNHAGSGAYGICQALPGSKMASAGADWATNPVTQLRWCDGYAKGRYGSWANAYTYWTMHYMW